MCDHCEALEDAMQAIDDEACDNFNPEENDTPPTDPYDSPSYPWAA